MTNQELMDIIRPLQRERHEYDCRLPYLDRTLHNISQGYGLNLNPDFQRGHVWTADQQRHFIENVLRRIVSASGLLIHLNDPSWDNQDYASDLPREIQCLDGLQRITAIQGFCKGEVLPFGFHINDLHRTQFDASRFYMKISIFTLQSKAEVLRHYLDLNSGGTPHSPAEIARVRAMLATTNQEPHHVNDTQ